MIIGRYGFHSTSPWDLAYSLMPELRACPSPACCDWRNSAWIAPLPYGVRTSSHLPQYLRLHPPLCCRWDVLQGNTEEELPEVALGGVRINALDLLAAKPLDMSASIPRSRSSVLDDIGTRRGR